MFSFKKSFAARAVLLLMIVALSVLLPLVGRGQGGEVKTPKRDPRKSFYVTKTGYDGSQALTACADGFHMASIWEILDPSNLHYDTQLGSTTQDSGSGPPVGGSAEAWIRTGIGATSSQTPGIGNCNAWTSASEDDFGTVVKLDFFWDVPATRISPWFAFTISCNLAAPVWCVQD